MLLPREIRITAAADTVINYFIMAVVYLILNVTAAGVNVLVWKNKGMRLIQNGCFKESSGQRAGS